MIMEGEVEKNKDSVDVSALHFVCKQVMFKLILYACASAVHTHSTNSLCFSSESQSSGPYDGQLGGWHQ